MDQKKILNQEEWIENITTKKHTCFSSIKAPLYDGNGQIIGIVGTSIDITAQKEAERLRFEAECFQKEAEHVQLENERRHNQLILQEKEKLISLACKVAHDINSPVAALRMMIDSYAELPEERRAFLRRATESILDIANNLISNYQVEENVITTEIELRELVLVSDLLVHLLSEKKCSTSVVL